MNGSVLEEKSFFNKMLELAFVFQSGLGYFTLSLLLKLTLWKLDPSFDPWSFFLLWKCWMSYKNNCVGLLILHLLPLLNPSLIVEIKWAYVFSIDITLVDLYLNWLNWFHFLNLVGALLVILMDCMIYISPFLVSFLAQLNFGIFCL